MPRFNNESFNNSVSFPSSRGLTQYQENLSSQADGSNTSFTVANNIDGTLEVSINGLIYTKADGNVSFTEGDKVFTISFAPQSDDIVIAIYNSYE
jgi:hypothetical protein